MTQSHPTASDTAAMPASEQGSHGVDAQAQAALEVHGLESTKTQAQPVTTPVTDDANLPGSSDVEPAAENNTDPSGLSNINYSSPNNLKLPGPSYFMLSFRSITNPASATKIKHTLPAPTLIHRHPMIFISLSSLYVGFFVGVYHRDVANILIESLPLCLFALGFFTGALGLYAGPAIRDANPLEQWISTIKGIVADIGILTVAALDLYQGIWFAMFAIVFAFAYFLMWLPFEALDERFPGQTKIFWTRMVVALGFFELTYILLLMGIGESMTAI